MAALAVIVQAGDQSVPARRSERCFAAVAGQELQKAEAGLPHKPEADIFDGIHKRSPLLSFAANPPL